MGLALLSDPLYAGAMGRACQRFEDATLSLSTKRLLFDLPGRYRIRIQGQLDPSWASRLSDMAITVRHAAGQQPVTTLTGD